MNFSVNVKKPSWLNAVPKPNNVLKKKSKFARHEWKRRGSAKKKRKRSVNRWLVNPSCQQPELQAAESSQLTLITYTSVFSFVIPEKKDRGDKFGNIVQAKQVTRI